MKSLILSLFFLLCAIWSFAQNTQKQYYEYNIFSFSNIANESLTINVDNGKTIDEMKDEKGKRIWFKTPVAALNYILSMGWEFYIQGESSGSTFQGTGNASTIYWIMRKQCTKEEFEKAVQNGIEK